MMVLMVYTYHIREQYNTNITNHENLYSASLWSSSMRCNYVYNVRSDYNNNNKYLYSAFL